MEPPTSILCWCMRDPSRSLRFPPHQIHLEPRIDNKQSHESYFSAQGSANNIWIHLERFDISFNKNYTSTLGSLYQHPTHTLNLIGNPSIRSHIAPNFANYATFTLLWEGEFDSPLSPYYKQCASVLTHFLSLSRKFRVLVFPASMDSRIGTVKRMVTELLQG